MTEAHKSEEKQVFASSDCPYCGVDTPHQHFIDRKGYVRGLMDPNEILGRTRDGAARAKLNSQKEERERIASKLQTHLENSLTGAQAALRRWKEACVTCRMFNHGLMVSAGQSAAMFMADSQFGMMRKGGDAFYCPDCGRCVWSGEH